MPQKISLVSVRNHIDTVSASIYELCRHFYPEIRSVSNYESFEPGPSNLSSFLVKAAETDRDRFSRLYDSFRMITSVYRLADEVMDLLPDGFKFLADYPVIRADLPEKLQKNSTPWHQEIMFYPYGEDSITLWLPLVPINEQTGSLEFIEGAVSNSLVPAQEYEVLDHRPYLSIRESYLFQAKYQVIMPKVEMYEGIIFNNLEIHKSPPNKTLDQTRLSLQLRFHHIGRMKEMIDLGCYFSPLHRPSLQELWELRK